MQDTSYNRGYNKQISLNTEAYTWFENTSNNYCLNFTVKFTVRQRTLIKTLKCTCELLVHINSPFFWELFVNCFVKPAQGLAMSFLLTQTADRRVLLTQNRHPSFFLRKDLLTLVLLF